MKDVSAKIGDPITDPPSTVFELVLSDYEIFVNPRKFGLSRTGIKPTDYFVTSGDAVEKAKVLDEDMWQLAGSLRKELFSSVETEYDCDRKAAQKLISSGKLSDSLTKLSEYETAVWKAAGQARKLLTALKLAKGVNCFLETEWDNHRIICVAKNPRAN